MTDEEGKDKSKSGAPKSCQLEGGKSDVQAQEAPVLPTGPDQSKMEPQAEPQPPLPTVPATSSPTSGNGESTASNSWQALPCIDENEEEEEPEVKAPPSDKNNQSKAKRGKKGNRKRGQQGGQKCDRGGGANQGANRGANQGANRSTNRGANRGQGRGVGSQRDRDRGRCGHLPFTCLPPPSTIALYVPSLHSVHPLTTITDSSPNQMVVSFSVPSRCSAFRYYAHFHKLTNWSDSTPSGPSVVQLSISAGTIVYIIQTVTELTLSLQCPQANEEHLHCEASSVTETMHRLVFLGSPIKTGPLFEKLQRLVASDSRPKITFNGVYLLNVLAFTDREVNFARLHSDLLTASHRRKLDQVAHQIANQTAPELAPVYQNLFQTYSQAYENFKSQYSDSRARCRLSFGVTKQWDDPTVQLCQERPPSSGSGRVYFSDHRCWYNLVLFEFQTVPLPERRSRKDRSAEDALFFAYEIPGQPSCQEDGVEYDNIHFFKETLIRGFYSLTIQRLKEGSYFCFQFEEVSRFEALRGSFKNWIGAERIRMIDLGKGRINKLLNPTSFEAHEKNGNLKRVTINKSFLDSQIQALCGSPTVEWPTYGTIRERWCGPRPCSAKKRKPKSRKGSQESNSRHPQPEGEVPSFTAHLIVLDVQRTLRRVVTKLAHYHAHVEELPGEGQRFAVKQAYEIGVQALRNFYLEAPHNWILANELTRIIDEGGSSDTRQTSKLPATPPPELNQSPKEVHPQVSVLTSAQVTDSSRVPGDSNSSAPVQSAPDPNSLHALPFQGEDAVEEEEEPGARAPFPNKNQCTSKQEKRDNLGSGQQGTERGSDQVISESSGVSQIPAPVAPESHANEPSTQQPKNPASDASSVSQTSPNTTPPVSGRPSVLEQALSDLEKYSHRNEIPPYVRVGRIPLMKPTPPEEPPPQRRTARNANLRPRTASPANVAPVPSADSLQLLGEQLSKGNVLRDEEVTEDPSMATEQFLGSLSVVPDWLQIESLAPEEVFLKLDCLENEAFLVDHFTQRRAHFEWLYDNSDVP